MAIPTAALDRVLIEAIDLSLWTLLFEALGYPSGVDKASVSIEQVVGSLENLSSGPLLEALQTIHDLNSDEARSTLFEIAEQETFSVERWKQEAPLGLAVRFVAQRVRDDAAKRVVEIALAVVYESRSPEPVKEFAGNAPKAASWSQKDVDRARGELVEFFVAQGMGSDLELHARQTAGGGAVLVVVHGQRRMATLVIDERGRRLLEYRPAISDVLRYDGDTGRLRIAARSARLIEKYREIAGQLFCRSGDFFLGDDLWTLEPLADLGQAGLTHATDSLGALRELRLVELHWRTVTGGTVRAKAKELFAEIERLDARLKESTLVEARFAVRIAGPRPNRVTICIRPPNHGGIPERFNAAVLPALTSLGIRRAPGDRSKRNLWALAGGPRHLREWREAYGAEADQMMRSGLLTAAHARSVAHVDQPLAHGALDVVEVELDDGDAALVGVPVHDGLPRMLTSSDIDAAELNEIRFAESLADVLGAGGGTTAARVAGTYALGVVKLGAVEVRPFVVLREPSSSNELVAEVAKVANGVLLIPVGCTTDSGLAEVELQKHNPPFDSNIINRVVAKLSLEQRVDAVHRVPSSDALVVDCSARRAWLYGQEVVFGDDGQRFRFVELVAYAAFKRSPLPSAELSERLSAGLEAHRRVKNEVNKVVRALFPGEKDLFPSRGPSQGYTVAVPVYVFGEPRSTGVT